MLQKPIKIIIYILLAGAGLYMLYNLFTISSELKQANSKIEESKAQINNALKEVTASQARLKDIQEDLKNFNKYVSDMQGRVEMMDLERKLRDARYLKQSDSIKRRISELNKEIDLTGQDLPDITDKDL